VRIVHLPLWSTLLLDAAVWGLWSALAGLIAWALPVSRFERDGFLTRLRPFETDGRFYQRRLRIRAWKDRLPEAGACYRGGFSKRRVTSRDRPFLERFAAETRRAEFTHWLVPAATPAFFCWNDWRLGLGMAVYALAANGPCIAVQRYNRTRLGRILVRSSSRRGIA
jgi:glycosyl-4,4'-diaponeurosporenoate acyltransferase